jgi:drug/metabolite transporter (DMT)-like permease
MNRRKGFIALLSTAVIYGTFGIFIRFLGKYLVGYQQIIYPNLLGVIIILVYVFVSRQELNLKEKRSIILYGLLYGLAGSLYTLSILSTKIATTVFSIYASSLTVSLLIGVLFLKEKFTNRKIGVLVLAFIGLVWFTYPLSMKTFDIGLLYGFVGGGFAVVANYIGKKLTDKVNNSILMVARLGGVAIGGVIMVVLNAGPILPNISVEGLLLSFSFALALCFVSFTVLVGFKNFDLNLGTVVISSELIFASLFAALFFKEYPKQGEIIGGLFIIAAILLANISLSKKKVSS